MKKYNIFSIFLDSVNKKRNVIIFFLVSLITLITTILFVNFEIIAYRINNIMHEIKMESVNVDGFEISMVLIDQDGREYNSSYTWNATNYDERRSLTLQINYKKTNNLSYEPGELEFKVPSMVTKKSYFRNWSDNDDSIITSSNPCTLSEKVTTWNWSYENTRCRANNDTHIDLSSYEYIYFTNTEKIDGSTNFEGSIRILFNEIYPESFLNGLDNTFHATLNNQLNTNDIRFRFTSTKKSYTMSNSLGKIDGYDNLPDNATNYIWVRLDPYYYSNSGVRGFVYASSTNEEIQLSGGLSLKPKKNSMRLRFSLPSNAIVYAPNESYTYEEENGVGFYRYNGEYYDQCSGCQLNYYYNGEYIGGGNDNIYIGFPKSQYTNKSVSFTTYLYGLYADYYHYFDDNRTHNYEYVTSEAKTINTADYYYETPSSDELYTTYLGSDQTLDVNNLKNGSDYFIYFNVIYTGTKLNVKVGNDVVYKKSTSGSISRLSENYYYFHRIQWEDYYLRDSSNNSLLPTHDIELYVRHRGSNSYVKYGETFTNDKNEKNFIFTENDIVGFYFMIHDVDTSIHPYSAGINYGPINYNIVYTNGISNGETVYNSSYIEAYRTNSSSPIYIPSSSSYTSDIASQLRSYDNSTYGHYITRDVMSIIAQGSYAYIYETYNNGVYSSMYKRNVYEAYDSFYPRTFANNYYKSSYIKENKGYEMYLLLPEGFYTDSQKLVNTECYSYDSSSYYFNYKSGFIKKRDGSVFNDYKEYCNYVKDHMTTQVINNWKNTNRTLMKAVVDFRDAPLDFTDFHYYHPYMFPSSWYNYYNLPEHFYFYFYYDKENIAEYNQTQFDIPHYLKPIGVTVPTNTNFSYAVRDELDIDSNGNSSEYITGGNSYINVLFTGESNQDLINFVRSEDDQYNSENTRVTYNEEYKYKLRVRTATNKITNVVIYDSLENYVKENGEFVKASGDELNTFKGTFMGVDTTYAQNQGYKVKVYYSESETPGSLNSDSSWKTYTEGSTDKTKVKSLAFEFYKSNGTTKAIIPTESLTYVEVKMKAPASVEDDKTVVYNGSWVEWNALDYNNNVIPNVVGISSNKVSVSIPTILKVRHLIKDTTTNLVPEETHNVYGGDEYTTSISTDIPKDYRFDSNAGDPKSGVISKTYTEVIYYYVKKDPILSSSINKTGTDTIDARGKQVSYQVSYTASVRDFIGDATVTIVDTLPYEIDTSKTYNLDGGTYNAANKTITWTKTLTTTSISQTSNTYTFNISFSYKNIPVPIRSITNKVTGTVSALNKTNSKEKTKSTNITEKFKLTVHHYYIGTTESISPDVVSYYDGGVGYNTNPADVPADYDITTPTNSSGVINQEETVVTYYYARKDPTLSASIEKSGTETISAFNDEIEYTINYKTEVSDYVGNVTTTIVDTLPYEIDTDKEYDLNGGVYDPTNKTITWTETFDKTNIESEEKNYTYTTKFVYKDITKTDRAFTNSVIGKTVLDNKSIEKNTSYTINIAVKGKIIVNYINIDTEEVLNEPLESEDFVFLNKFIPEALDIDTFDLVESPEEDEYDYEEETKELYFKYKKRRHKITTKVSGSDGTITGDEEVDEGTDSTKNKIKIKANNGYVIARVMINGETVEIGEQLTEYTLNNFINVREDKDIVVEFAKKLENPATGSFMPIITIFGLSILGVGLYLLSKKYNFFKKI